MPDLTMKPHICAPNKCTMGTVIVWIDGRHELYCELMGELTDGRFIIADANETLYIVERLAIRKYDPKYDPSRDSKPPGYDK